METLYTVLLAIGVVIVAYLIGSIPTSIIVARCFGVKDIREHGSHNAGGTNVGRVVGKGAGLLTIVIDIFKCYIPCLAVFFIFEGIKELPLYINYFDHISETMIALCALGVCIGHTFPCYVGFKGGKAVACFAGYILFISPAMFAIGFTEFMIVYFTSKRVSVASVITVPSVILLSLVPVILDLTVLSDTKAYNGGVYFSSDYFIQISYVTTIAIAVLAAIVVIRHLANIKRLEHGEEPETHFRHKGAAPVD